MISRRYEIIEPDAASDPVYEVAEDSKFYKGVVVPKLPEPYDYKAAKDMY